MPATTHKSSKKVLQKQYRFDARLNESQRILLQRAADLEGRSLTDFVLQSAESAAERTIQERTILLLNARESEAFVEMVLNPPEPRKVLHAAAKRYKERLGR